MKALLMLALLLGPPAFAGELTGKTLGDGRKVTLQAGAKGMVVVFLSATCPCSNSHVQELKELSSAYPDLRFYAVHSNTDEGEEVSKSYFERASLPFPVIQDTGARIADELGALKTPHAFLFHPSGQIVYKGGVSNSSDFSRASRKFLRDAIESLVSGKNVDEPEGRTLGCVISRGGKDAW